MVGHVDRVGHQVGEYRILRWLGGGGFGDVYLGEHPQEHTQVAVKVLHGRLTRHDDLKEFINEARTIHLKHPHIVSLLDFGIASDDTPFLVMTYAPHGTLRDRHPKGSQVPLPIIISYVQQLASALNYAHIHHLVHRDVKPENMLVIPSYEILLSDFGIAEIVHSSRSLAKENGISGTLPYLAPEQIAGKPQSTSDQYALGIVVYEWITGRRPFTGTAAEIALQHTTTTPPSLREQIPTLPIDVEQVVMRALEKDPKNRFADIEAFARALGQAIQQTETPKPPEEHSSSIRSPLPTQEPSPARPLAEQTNVVDPTVIGTPIAPMPAVSFSGVEGMALVTQAVDGPVASPTVSVLSRQELNHSRFPPPASIEFTQSLSRRRLSWRTAVLLLVLALLILGSAGGLYTTERISTARTLATTTANSQALATARVQATAGAADATSISEFNALATQNVANLTATAQAQAQATASVIAANPDPYGGTLAFYDPLTDNSNGNGWAEGTHCQFAGGAYHVIIMQTNFFWACPATITNFNNFDYQVQMKIIKGDGGGIAFRGNVTNSIYHGYIFSVRKDGSYQLWVNPSNATASNSLWIGSSGAINLGLNQTNLVTVRVTGNTFTLYVNQQKIGSVTDSTFSHGEIGVIASAASSPADVVYSNAKVWRL